MREEGIPITSGGFAELSDFGIGISLKYLKSQSKTQTMSEMLLTIVVYSHVLGVKIIRLDSKMRAKRA
eukprot:4701113-Amphidinium_carterae.1